MKNSNINMVARFIFTALCMFVPMNSAEGFEPPEIVTIDMLAELYEPVVFDHALHLESYSCGECHHHTAGDKVQRESCRRCHTASTRLSDVSCVGCHLSQPGDAGRDGDIYHIDKPGLQGALHLQCLGCHNEEGGPVGCMECHEFTPAGRKRFSASE
jgi:hypothetical protein